MTEPLIGLPALSAETGPGILLPLVHIYKRCPEAIVSVFPSDHFILEEEMMRLFANELSEALPKVEVRFFAGRNPLRFRALA